MGQAISKGVQVVSIIEQTASDDDQVVPIHEPKSTCSLSYQKQNALQQAVPIHELKSPWSPSDQIQNELQQAAETACKEVFPFEKLPPELQVEVIRFAMPQAGLRSGSRPRWVKGADGLLEPRDCEPLKGENMPVSLFRTSKSISATALWIFYSKVPLQIDVFTYVIWYNQEKRYDWADKNHFASALQIQELPQFRCIRNYHINLTLEDWWFAAPVDRQAFRASIFVFKERLRLICDALANNQAIQRLTVSIPCLCCLPMNEDLPPPAAFLPSVTGLHTHGDHSQSYMRILDVLSPLTRIKVAKPVVFRAIFNHGKGEFQIDRPMEDCTRVECKNFAQNVQQVLGRLDGKDLLDEEKEWKRVKELDRGNPGMRSIKTVELLERLWERLSEFQYWRGVNAWCDSTFKELFDDAMDQAEKSVRKDYRRWQQGQAEKRREESLRRFREEGPLAKLWSGGLQKEYEDLSMRKHRTQEDRKWLMIFKEVFESKEREWRRLTLEWHERNPPVPGLEDSDDDSS
ncbi:MAG: hypothetical protein L6R38_009754 [Xanthoria sp. 2 TBL-2021]|nr:MAG: hypothetical protein L6R38_009754 [Xanthoria sp. 2 TBL-2021]